MFKREFIPGLFILPIFIISVIIYFNYDMSKKKAIIEQLNEEYPLIIISENINGVVTSIHEPDLQIFRYSSTFARVILNDSIKRRIKTSTYDKVVIGEVLQVGDRLIKESGTDRFSIYKIKNGDTLKYSFELRDDLGYPLSKYNQ